MCQLELPLILPACHVPVPCSDKERWSDVEVNTAVKGFGLN